VTARTTTKAGSLAGRTLVLTRPAGTASALAQQVRQRGGVPLLLPGLSLRPMDDPAVLRVQLAEAMHDELLLFSSPAAVRYAAALLPLRTRASVLAVGQGTVRALRRHGIEALAPSQQQDSDGLLALPVLQHVRDRRIALIGAPGGRGLLREQLVGRGAHLRELHVYRRVPPRLDGRHVAALLCLPADARVLLSSAEALQNLLAVLPPAARARLCAAVAVVSSARIAELAAAAGFAKVRLAASAGAADLLDAAT
jgi:uroporphyrinogen-III synthase